MVSADNLNLDCLELIFAYLTGNDLASVSLVSGSFLAGVVPFLYRTLVYHLGNAKRRPLIMTPFETVVQHRSLAVHVRSIDIRTAPLVKGVPHAKFMGNLIACMRLCVNLENFTCMPTILPALLNPLQDHPNLQGLRVSAVLTAHQTRRLATMSKLKSLSLDSCSWNVVDILPSWASTMTMSLTSLIFHTIQELNDCILETMLPHLPNLTSLSVVGCSKVEHGTILHATRHTPKLRNLAFTVWDATPLPPNMNALPYLRHIAIDTHIAPVLNGNAHATSHPLWHTIIALTKSWGCSLTSITLRLSEKTPISPLFIEELLEAHSSTLAHIAMINFDIPWESVKVIATKCERLERLAFHIPHKDVQFYSNLLRHSKTLKQLTDVGESHALHATPAFSNRTNVKTMMLNVPSLQKLVTVDRIWTCDKSSDWQSRSLKLKPEKRKNATPEHWFLPR
ncbi:hypothetical protein PHLGIDRAFT_84443 [Phlebiopsis gigantea 11061_1 CR5-6]|uniref:F-box domain-containing protein n=1 Tax=Phlebiopsis gigantea (strain 11061_1 CR5-6) TaxID=745531 RepID=A0A0C3SER1_PHLG1|nr:hypothetical protein PHLGIDRAFT_84443 [Phlebiopsis gigantea 11061_1 CR5-6]